MILKDIYRIIEEIGIGGVNHVNPQVSLGPLLGLNPAAPNGMTHALKRFAPRPINRRIHLPKIQIKLPR